MSDKDEKIVGLMENPITLNYAVTCTAFNLDEKPKILLVDYLEYPDSDIQKRLPGGKFQTQDLISSVESFLGELSFSGNVRNQSLEFLCGEVYNLNKEYLSLIETIKDHSKQNWFFNDLTEKLLVKLQRCNLSETEFTRILVNAHLNTVHHELKEEADARKIGDINISSSSLNYGVHHKIGFVSSCVEAPSCYKGSPDPKILKSDWYDIDENTSNLLFNGHKINFQEGIREAIKLNIHPNVGILKKFLTAAN